MVHDPRVSHQLARLGGVYRDPARVDRDASTLLKSSVGMHLQPIVAAYNDTTTNSTGSTGTATSSTVLVLQGTIAMHFRGATYQLLVDMYLLGGYPIRPPVCFVRLADTTMYLKPNHKHVGSDGKVYLPYLHEWSSTSHNLIELVVAMSSVFSADPPVFSRPPTIAPAPTNTAATATATPAAIKVTPAATKVTAIPDTSNPTTTTTKSVYQPSSILQQLQQSSLTFNNKNGTYNYGSNGTNNTNNNSNNNGGRNGTYTATASASSLWNTGTSLFGKPSTTTPATTTTPTYAASTGVAAGTASMSATTSNGRSEQEQYEMMLAREAAEANAAVEVARRAEVEEMEQTRLQQYEEEKIRRRYEENKRYEESRLIELRIQVQHKIQQYCIERSIQVRKDIHQDNNDNNLLTISSTQKVQYQIKVYTEMKLKISQQLQITQQRIKDIEVWLQQQEQYMKSTTNNNDEQSSINGSTTKRSNVPSINNIDKIVVPMSKIDEQMIVLDAENSSLQDSLYYIDRSLYDGIIDCMNHIKFIRSIAKKQFYIRALILKIQQQYLHNGHRQASF